MDASKAWKVLSVIFLYLVNQMLCQEMMYEEEWKNFKVKYGKPTSRSEEEENYRRSIFIENLDKVKRHNILYENGSSTYKMGVNKFSDMTFEEFKKSYLMPERQFNDVQNSTYIDHNDITKSRVKSPDRWDWRDAWILPPVKDQSDCSSCWAFAAVASIEAAWKRSSVSVYVPVKLSEQSLIDCTPGYTCEDGGEVYEAYERIIADGGIMSEDDYPYTGKRGASCKYDATKKKAKISGYKKVYANKMNSDELADSIYEFGPHAAYIYFNDKLEFWEDDIFEEPDCPKRKVTDHAVVIVGYDKVERYWIIRNSWGTDWGVGGHGKIRMGQNVCNLELEWFYPIV